MKRTDLYKKIDATLKEPNPLIVILGPTASGKTALSIDLAKKYNCEVLSADSRQIYKEYDISTDKIHKKDMKGIRHHLIDFVEPDKVYTVADWKRDALKIIEDIYKRKKIPMIVGGTGLYINALVYDFDIPAVPPNPVFRKKLEDQAKKYGVPYIYNKLLKKDPETAKKFDPNNVRYIVRALEINHFTKGKKIDKKGKSKFNSILIGIKWPREVLNKRIDERVEKQFERGVVEESKKILKKYDLKLPSISALGCKEFLPYFKGEKTLEEVKERLKINTHQYARRQIVWSKRDKKIIWL